MPTLTNDSISTSHARDELRPHLFVVMTCARPQDGSSRHALDDVDDVYIGRGATRGQQRAIENGRSVLRITIPDDRISTSHAHLRRDADGWSFGDLRSKNGSRVNGVATIRALLADGDVAQLGQTLLLFREALPTPHGAHADVIAAARASAFATLVPSLARDFDALAAVAPTEMPVLLVSETGTGKEVLARAIHALSRRKGAFVPVNCGALPATLAESTLFGHKRGAFSGAVAESAGLVRAADDGTLLLDELGDLPLPLQPTLLRALQEGEVLPVGATAPVRHRARFLGATHRNLEEQVASGTFREDLYARLAGFVFRVPSLRERREDIGLLANELLRRIAGDAKPATLTAEAGAILLAYRWPRNIRELEKCLARAALFAGNGPIEPSHLGLDPSEGPSPAPSKGKEAAPRGEPTRARLVEQLTLHRGNLQAVADALRTSRSQVHRMLKRFDIDVERYRA